MSRLIKKAPLVGAFLLSTFFLGSVYAQCPLPPSLPPVSVARVTDGDTLRLADGRRVRLIGINAPEVAGKDRSAQPYALAAKRRLQALIAAAGGQVILVPGAHPKDRYGRLLANVYTPNANNLEARLLQEGLAYQVVIPPNDALSQCHALAEQGARFAQAGLWKGFKATSAAKVKQSGFQVISGTLLKVEVNSGGLWLTLQGGVVLHVAQGSQPDFSVERLHNLRGRVVEARGWVVERGRRSGQPTHRARWLLRLTAPDMLQVVPSEPKVVGATP